MKAPSSTLRLRLRDFVCVLLVLVSLSPPSLFPSSTSPSSTSHQFLFSRSFYLRNAEVDHEYDSSTPTYIPRSSTSPGYLIARRGGALKSYVSMYDVRTDYKSDQMIYLSEENSNRQLAVIKGTTEGYYAASNDHVLEIDNAGIISFCYIGSPSSGLPSAFTSLKQRPVLLEPTFQFDFKEMDVEGFRDHQRRSSSSSCSPTIKFSQFGIQFVPKLQNIDRDDLLEAASEWERKNEDVFLVTATVEITPCAETEDDETSEDDETDPNNIDIDIDIETPDTTTNGAPPKTTKCHVLSAITATGEVLYASSSKPLHLVDLNDDRAR
ncbi:hypothetical protein TL16_g12901 [Triparma laevis f. inornata]|uniref:Uncharacterized protein n=1 Tax=Triparma laevis f. inornata TaxID=1714386 RepID=A0A9W7BU13_9STRA|nr:hypothetical protein TL16_g12901 [Triparma laevis f. inornata]